MAFLPTIGLEIHVELDTRSKMFCSCKNNPDEKRPNTNICQICLGHPGTLPVINKEAVRRVIKVGLALGCEIPQHSSFDRKNYFYPDLPKGYQISQHFAPLCKNGSLEVDGRGIRIGDIHLEEDTCRLSHSNDGRFSLIDCNRAGIPLMELVTMPDLKSAKEASNFARILHLLLGYLDVSTADMEKGQMRIEANVSLSKDRNTLGTRVELKNINSFKALEKAINYEIERQGEILERGEKVIQQTRGWDDKKAETVLQRIKETSKDYRYFPEPDLPLLKIKQDFLDKIRAELPELPWQKKKRLAQEYRLADNDVDILIQDKELGEYFEKVVSELPPRLEPEKIKEMTRLAFNYLTTDLMFLINNSSDIPITPENFAELMTMLFRKEVSSKTGKDVLREMFKTGADPSQLVGEKKLTQITNQAEIAIIVKKVIAENPKAVSDFKSGKENALQFLLGKAMVESRGKTEPRATQEIIKRLLLSPKA